MRVVRERFHILRQKFRAPSPEPARVWIRREWWKVGLLAVSLAAITTLNVWLFTCGFEGCPSGAEIAAYRPNEGGRIFDQNGKQIGNLAIVRRINVPLARVPKTVRQ